MCRMYLGDLKIHCTLPEQHERADARDMISATEIKSWWIL